jgi:DNA-binding winged helix-turn-helix (wHTH) protein
MADFRPGMRDPVRFGVFELDPSTGELRKHGVRIKLQDQPFALLLMLLEKPGQLVTKEELRQRLWPADTFVEFDKGIYNAMKRLRETLGDGGERPIFIETIPRKGYRFIAPLVPDCDSAPLAE